ncbi:ArnT family glycosyltransferase [Alicyclobacillus hesperidum]|uniref:ArnT family glycosyltransferase n=1 Tax=Alicyclobacillus hesperidum TaxID=89784 RepID=UPI000311AE90|nr:glycosyltransferase family 39 protein [Alicyclobacillus hesperidum]
MTKTTLAYGQPSNEMDHQKRLDWPLFALLFISILIHLPTLNMPLISIDAWRQTDEESIVYHFVHNSMNILHPAVFYDGLGPQRVQLELQIIPWLTACLVHVLGWHIWLLHLIPDACFSCNVWLCYRVARAFSAPVGIARTAAAMYLLTPYDIYYGQALMPEVVMTTGMLLSVWSTVCYAKKPTWERSIVTGLAICLMLLAKLPSATVLPALAVVVIGEQGFSILARARTWVPVFVAIAITWFYTAYEGKQAAHAFITGDTHAYLLQHLGDVFHPQTYLQAGWFGATTAVGLAVAPAALYGCFCACPNALAPFRQAFAAWLSGAFLFTAWVATHNALHYYYIVLTVPAAMLASLGVWQLWRSHRLPLRTMAAAIVCGAVTISVVATPTYYQPAEAPAYRLGRQLQAELPANEGIALVASSPILFDYAKRGGWRWYGGDKTAAYAQWLQQKWKVGAGVAVIEDPRAYPDLSEWLKKQYGTQVRDGHLLAWLPPRGMTKDGRA